MNWFYGMPTVQNAFNRINRAVLQNEILMHVKGKKDLNHYVTVLMF